MAWCPVVMCLMLATTLVLAGAVNKNKTVHILSLLPYPDPLFSHSWREGLAISLALDMARDQINNQTELLPDYHIELIHDDSGCEYTTKAYVSLMRNVFYSDKKVIGIVGPGCSRSTAALAQLTSRKEVALVTVHGGGSPLLSNRTLYPYALSSLGSHDLFKVLGIKLMEKSNWKRVGVLFDESLFYSSNAQEFIKSVDNSNLTGFAFPVYVTFIPLESIMNKGLRINFLFTPVETTQRVLCLAMHQGMVYDAYQWIITSNFFDEVAKDINFNYNGRQYNCSAEDMKTTALSQAVFLDFQLSPLNETAPSTYSKYSFREYDQSFRETIDKYKSLNIRFYDTNISYSVWSTYFYDSLWAWSVALDSLTRNQPGLDLTKYGYGDTAFSDMVMEEFYNLDFEGVSGSVKFLNDSGSAVRTLSVVQVSNGSAQQVACFDNVRTVLNASHKLVSIPDVFDSVVQGVSKELVVTFLIITLLQLAVVLVLHVLTIRYRSYPSVKASSFKLNIFLFVGCYALIILLLVETVGRLWFDEFPTSFVCNLTTVWMLPIMFTVVFGTVAVRTWRLYRIFTHYLRPSQFIGDYRLMTFVLLLVLVDIVLGTVWTAVEPYRIKVSMYHYRQEIAVFHVRRSYCKSERHEVHVVFVGLVYCWKVLLMTAVVVLSILTRSITNQSFTTKTLRVFCFLFCPHILIGHGTYIILSYVDPVSVSQFVVYIVVYTLALLLLIILIILPPLLPLIREKFVKSSKRQRPIVNVSRETAVKHFH